MYAALTYKVSIEYLKPLKSYRCQNIDPSATMEQSADVHDVQIKKLK